MTGITFNLKIIGLIAAGAILAILAIVVPDELWTEYAYAASASVALTVVLPFFLNLPMKGGESNDAQEIWLVGPYATFIFWLLFISVVSFGLSMFQLPKLTWVGCVIWGALFIIGYFSLSSATQVVSVAASQTNLSSDDIRTKWMASLRQALVQSKTEEDRKKLERVIENIRYSANDQRQELTNENVAITNQINLFLEAPIGSTDWGPLIFKLESLLTQREELLKASRSQA